MLSAKGQCPECGRKFTAAPRQCCLTSGFHFPDQIPKLALATLPEILEFKTGVDESDRCVVSRTWIPTRSVFGPLIAPSVPRTPFSSARFAVGSGKTGWQDCILDSDVRCNWMKYVRPADSVEDQNLTAFQLDGKVYFASIREITLGDELKVACSPKYLRDREKVYTPPVRKIVDDGPNLDYYNAMYGTGSNDAIGMDDNNLDKDWTPQQKYRAKKRTAEAAEKELTSFPCLFCERRFLFHANLRTHYKAHMQKDGEYACPKCDHQSTDLAAVKRHIKRHKLKQLYEFNQADMQRKQTAAAEELNTTVPLQVPHDDQDSDSESFDCAVCGIQFATAQRLEVHAATHLKWRPIKCDQCSHAFKHAEHLQQHKRLIHDNDRPRDCVYDGKRQPLCTKEKDYMEMTYKCRDCKVGFLVRKRLIEHMEARHPLVPLTSVPELNFPVKTVTCYRCSPCHCNFVSEFRYMRHVETRHAKNPTESSMVTFQYTAHHCIKCDKTFWGAADFVKHTRSLHPEYLESLMNGQQPVLA